MSDTKTEEEPRSKEPAKKGLHGWKAATAVFGCGTLAAFGVFGVIVGLLSAFLGAVSEGITSDEDTSVPAATGTVEPREEFKSDKFDLCAIIGSISAANLTLDPSGYPEYVDASLDGGSPTEDDLVRSGECAGEVRIPSAQYEPLNFEFSYKSIVYNPNDGKDDISGEDLESWKAEFEESGSQVDQSGESDFLDDSYFYYGGPADGSGSSYQLFARKRSSVVSISLSSSQEISDAAYRNAVNNFEPRLDEDLNGFIPE